MDDEDDFQPGEPIVELAREDLDPLSVEELDARIRRLEAEIERVKAHKAGKTGHMSAADALFAKR
ncbi:DUF1192 domain-containing protein [Sphingomicrobium astaxanthinifaciens]|uniref:DUF1192 domain-containing protein n=1 Tax=Sphingomicrobium astaxanthinifaciens TaxID=1227949 RepID=UPI001FCAC41F|nr:DUF1192 domain-containing protein [Sphingomicrobium astaxanthinifaciens]MCJ7420608.1 DUF1192 domain-containing protein [Sphingomicrobium astaxanthinifaciens]